MDKETVKKIVKELSLLEKYNTANGMIDYDGFSQAVFRYMEKLKRAIKTK